MLMCLRSGVAAFYAYSGRGWLTDLSKRAIRALFEPYEAPYAILACGEMNPKKVNDTVNVGRNYGNLLRGKSLDFRGDVKLHMLS